MIKGTIEQTITQLNDNNNSTIINQPESQTNDPTNR
jgi:hypothetical protein